jgi:hypothetical protein
MMTRDTGQSRYKAGTGKALLTPRAGRARRSPHGADKQGMQGLERCANGS